MATYIIVDKDTNPLGPGQIHAGTDIQVSDGDVYIIDSSVDSSITFKAAGGAPADFDVQFASSNSNSFTVKIESNLTPSITIEDDVNLSNVDLDAKAATAVNFDAGDNVSFGKYEGSVNGPNNIAIGDGFTTDSDWKLGNTGDSMIVGNDATFDNIDTGGGNDTIVFGDRATLHDIDTKGGNDSVTFGDDLDANNIKTSDGNDTIYVGQNAQVAKFDGGSGTDQMRSETAGVNTSNMESYTVVCFAAGTLIATESGDVPVEALRPGDALTTMDDGFAPLRWVGQFDATAEELRDNERLRPIRISAAALGPGVPSHDLVVSPNHRVLVQSVIAERICGAPEVLIAAKKLVAIDGIDRIDDCAGVRYFHLLLDAHQILFADGAATESMYLGVQTLLTLSGSQRCEIEARLGAAVPLTARHRPARLFLDKKQYVDRLIARHQKNRKAFQVPPAAAALPALDGGSLVPQARIEPSEGMERQLSVA